MTDVEAVTRLADPIETLAAREPAVTPAFAGTSLVPTVTTERAAARQFDDAPFPPDTLLAGRYRIVRLLGRGGMGVVYQADDIRIGHPVALKFLPPALAHDPRRLAQFHSEVSLVRFHNHVVFGARLYIDDALTDRGRFGFRVVLRGTIDSGAGERITAHVRCTFPSLSCRIVAESLTSAGSLYATPEMERSATHM